MWRHLLELTFFPGILIFRGMLLYNLTRLWNDYVVDVALECMCAIDRTQKDERRVMLNHVFVRVIA